MNEPLDRIYPAGSLVWPIFFGRLRVENMQAVTNHHGTIQLLFGEPVDVVPSFPDTCSAGGEIFPVILSTNQEACGGAKLSWTRSINAKTYKVKSADTAGGPYTLVATTEQTYLDIQIPLFRSKFYIVIAVRDDLESQPSNEVEVQAITIEREMRATQERYRQGRFLQIDPSDPVDDWLFWPYRNSDGENPGKYPGDGFYDADLFPGGVLDVNVAVMLVQHLTDQFHDGWLNGYSSKADGEFEHLAAIPLHSVSQEGTSGRFSYWITMPPLTVNENNYEQQMRTIVSRLCSLKWIVMPMTQVEIEEKHSSGNGFKYVESGSIEYLGELWANSPSALGDIQGPAEAGWSAIDWKQFYNFRYDNSDKFVPVTYSPGFPYGETIGENLGTGLIGVSASCGTYNSRDGEFGTHKAWDCSFHNDRGKLFADLRPFTRLEPRKVYLWMTQQLNGQISSTPSCIS